MPVCMYVYDQIIVVVSLCALRVGVFPRGLGFFTPMLKAKQKYIQNTAMTDVRAPQLPKTPYMRHNVYN